MVTSLAARASKATQPRPGVRKLCSSPINQAQSKGGTTRTEVPAIRGDKGEPTQRDGWHLVNQTLVTTEWLTPVNNSSLSYNETAEREREREKERG